MTQEELVEIVRSLVAEDVAVEPIEGDSVLLKRGEIALQIWPQDGRFGWARDAGLSSTEESGTADDLEEVVAEWL